MGGAFRPAAWQGKGLGRLLMQKLIGDLRSRGTSEIVGQCLVHNAAMEALARHAGFEVAAVPTGDTVALRLRLR